MEKDNRLVADEHDWTLRHRIIPRSGFVEASSHSVPKAVILAGQPGAAKRGFGSDIVSEMNGDAVVLDPDRLQIHHPQFKSLHQRYPYAWAAHTQYDAAQWSRELGMAAIDARKNISVDTTLGDHNGAIRTIRVLQLCIPSLEPSPCSATGALAEHGLGSTIDAFASRLFEMCLRYSNVHFGH
ncbi:zeta toxin family protein [uncultured Stenotrophomonas sp.]|uniref:zeta toxin family protein n=1 Tax=uncultured Stenotrophomonas sp. TaxID=165438 RepID=UPI0025DF4BB9|nr:zeta toxin family protein [uncultured Stenotrophomonas sp.]